MATTALFPGSFDPVTLGHVNIIERGLKLFERLYVGIGTNTSKNALFSLEDRKAMLQELFRGKDGLEIVEIKGLTIDWCRQNKVQCLLRGIRSATDMEYERSIADMNHQMAPEIETVFLMADPQVGHIQARIVREILLSGGDASSFIPNQVLGFARKIHKS